MSLFGMAWSLASTLAKLKGYDIQLIWEWFPVRKRATIDAFQEAPGRARHPRCQS